MRVATGLAMVVLATAACDIDPLTRVEIAPPVAEIRLIMGADRLVEGDTTSALAIPRDAEGETLDATVQWTSSSPEVARVDQQGRITAVDEGETTITARVGAIGASQSLTVVQRVASIEIPGDVFAVTVGDTVQLVARLRDAEGRPAEDRVARWGTSDPSIASVSKRGSVRGQSPGMAQVSARIDAVADTVEVRVSPAEER